MKAWAVCIFFSVIAIIAWIFIAPHTDVLFPQVIFYAVITMNTFYSVRLYSHIQPRDLGQKILDALLVIAYICLALSLGNAYLFPYVALWIFLLATPKYVLMLGRIPYGALLKRKILIDISGGIFCALIFTLSLAGFAHLATWAFALIFLMANIYLLFINPMYEL